MFLQNPSERDGRIYTRPVALPLAEHCEPGNRLDARLDHPLHSQVMGLDGCAPGSVCDSEDVKALALRLNGGHSEADFRPKSRYHQLLSPGFLHGFHKFWVLPRVDKSAIDWLLVGKYVLQTLDEVPTAFRQYSGQYGRNPECFRALRERDYVGNDRLRFVTVKVGELEWLMVDENQYALFRREKRFEARIRGLWHHFSSPRMATIQAGNKAPARGLVFPGIALVFLPELLEPAIAPQALHRHRL